MNQQKALQNLIDARNVLEKNNLRYFLTDGTLLGAVRENNFIGHDTDLDMGVFMKEWTIKKFSKVVEDMLKKGFILYHSFGEFGKHFECAWWRDNIKLDFFFYYEHFLVMGSEWRFNAFLNGGRGYPKGVITYNYPSKFLDVKGYIKFLGADFVIPDYPAEFLKIKYGDDWRTPKKKWNWCHDPKNLVNIN